VQATVAGALISWTAGLLPDCWWQWWDAASLRGGCRRERERRGRPRGELWELFRAIPLQAGGVLVSQVGHLWGHLCATRSADRPPNARLHDRGRGQVCFRSLPIATAAYWSRQSSVLRAPRSRQKQSLSSPSDRLQAGVRALERTPIVQLEAIQDVLCSLLPFRPWGREGGAPMSRVELLTTTTTTNPLLFGPASVWSGVVRNRYPESSLPRPTPIVCPSTAASNST
jgi:hypothetical protein